MSLQASSFSKTAWKLQVREAARLSAVPAGSWALTDLVAVTIYYFPEGEMAGDIDNIVKPILDALCHFAFVDDHQVERVVVQRFEPERVFTFAEPSPTLVAALAADKPAVYIRISDNPHEDLQ